jgi:hypothetical protein
VKHGLIPLGKQVKAE